MVEQEDPASNGRERIDDFRLWERLLRCSMTVPLFPLPLPLWHGSSISQKPSPFRYPPCGCHR